MSEVIRGLSCFFAGALTYLIYRKINLKFEKINTNLFSVVEFLLIFLIIYIISYVEEYKAIYASLIFLVIVFFFAFEKGVLSKILKFTKKKKGEQPFCCSQSFAACTGSLLYFTMT